MSRRVLLAVAAMVILACFGKGKGITGPVAAGTFGFEVTDGITRNKSNHFGSAAFSPNRGHTRIFLWADTTDTTVWVLFRRATALADTGVYNVTNVRQQPNDFFAVDSFTTTASLKGGTVHITTLSGTTIAGDFDYSGVSTSNDADTIRLRGSFTALLDPDTTLLRPLTVRERRVFARATVRGVDARWASLLTLAHR